MVNKDLIIPKYVSYITRYHTKMDRSKLINMT